MSDSFITLSRKILSWEWYLSPNEFRLFIHCLIKANWRDKEWRGINISRGSFVTSQQKLADELNLSRKQIIGSLKKLEKTKEISKIGHNKYTLVTIVKYDDYQSLVVNEGQQRDNKGTSKAQQRDTTNNSNNNNNSNKDIVYYAVEENFSETMANEKYVDAFTKKFNMSKERLETLYQEFNQHLIIVNDDVKSNQDYVSHFLSWYCKRYNVNRTTGRKMLKHRNML
jgi:biotin operon repressor